MQEAVVEKWNQLHEGTNERGNLLQAALDYHTFIATVSIRSSILVSVLQKAQHLTEVGFTFPAVQQCLSLMYWEIYSSRSFDEL